MNIQEILENKNKSDIVKFTGAISSSEIKKTKNGDGYLSLSIMDKSGQISCKKWGTSNIGDFTSETVVDIEGTVDVYSGIKSVTIDNIKKNINISIDTFDNYDIETAEKTLDSIIEFIDGWVDDVSIKKVAKYILNKYRKEFLKSVGATKNHHSEIGGLLKHSREVLKICGRLLPTIENLYGIKLNKNVLYCGALLHDIGKIDAYITNLISGEMSTAGKLLDHITLSTIIINEAYVDLKLDKDSDYLELLHIVVSHHMSKEWGSMVEPKNMEAYLIHFADNMSAKLSVISKSIQDSNSESEWVKSYCSNEEFYNPIK